MTEYAILMCRCLSRPSGCRLPSGKKLNGVRISNERLIAKSPWARAQEKRPDDGMKTKDIFCTDDAPIAAIVRCLRHLTARRAENGALRRYV
jgi:hypothetical protein